MTNHSFNTPVEMHYRAVYTEPMLRQAVRLFLWRGVIWRRGWIWLTAIALLGISLARGWNEEPTWMSAINIGAILLIPLLFLFVWRSHFLNTVGKFRSMTRLHADFAFRDRDVTMTSELGSMTLPWTCFIDVWETPEFFMLFLERDQFITLPSRDMSEEIRAVLCSLLPHTT